MFGGVPSLPGAGKESQEPSITLSKLSVTYLATLYVNTSSSAFGISGGRVVTLCLVSLPPTRRFEA